MSLPADHEVRLARAMLSLTGLSVGDALGECFFQPEKIVEQLLAARATPAPPWSTTDDTEMALAIVDVLAERGSIDEDALAAGFARRYRLDPRRGYGGTAHRILREIGEGQPWRDVSSAVFGGTGSMGNGGAMRVAPVGAYFADDLQRAIDEARASARPTHAHPDGQAGAIAVAVAAATAWQMRGAPDGAALLAAALEYTPSGPTRDGIARAVEFHRDGISQTTAARVLGTGHQVISSDTVPYALLCAARHLDSYVEAFWATVAGLGDRDTTCAIVGGIVALSAGESAIPRPWLAARERLRFADDLA